MTTLNTASNRSAPPNKGNKRNFGENIEQEVQDYLKKKGLKPIQNNFSCKTGEIDLIMQEQDTVVFVEVRYRKNDKFGSGAETVTRSKQKRLIRTAHFFLLKKPNYANFPCRFDVVSVQPSADNTYNKVHWIPNAFEAYS